MILNALSTSSRLSVAKPGLDSQIRWFLGQPHTHRKMMIKESVFQLMQKRPKKLNGGEL